MMTVAPEIEGARALIEHFRDRILFSIGHTAARLRRVRRRAGVGRVALHASLQRHDRTAITASRARSARR